jgi:gas vesicle protein
MGDFLVGILLGTVIGTVGTLMYARSKRSRKVVTRPLADTPKVSLNDIIGSEPQDTVAELRQSLLLKFMFDEEKIERAIAFERERQPQASAEEHLKAAIERWERDNR